MPEVRSVAAAVVAAAVVAVAVVAVAVAVVCGGIVKEATDASVRAKQETPCM